MKIIAKAKPVRFRIVSGGHECDSLETLHQHFVYNDIIQTVEDGRIVKWLHTLHGVNASMIEENLSDEDAKNISPFSLLSTLFPEKYEQLADESNCVFLSRIKQYAPTEVFRTILKEYSSNDLEVLKWCLKDSLLKIGEMVNDLNRFTEETEDPELLYLYGKVLIQDEATLLTGEEYIRKSQKLGFADAINFINRGQLDKAKNKFAQPFFVDVNQIKIKSVISRVDKEFQGLSNTQYPGSLNGILKNGILWTEYGVADRQVVDIVNAFLGNDSFLHDRFANVLYNKTYLKRFVSKLPGVNEDYLICLIGVLYIGIDNTKAKEYFTKSHIWPVSEQILEQFDDFDDYGTIRLSCNGLNKIVITQSKGIKEYGIARTFLLWYFKNLFDFKPTKQKEEAFADVIGKGIFEMGKESIFGDVLGVFKTAGTIVDSLSGKPSPNCMIIEQKILRIFEEIDKEGNKSFPDLSSLSRFLYSNPDGYTQNENEYIDFINNTLDTLYQFQQNCNHVIDPSKLFIPYGSQSNAEYVQCFKGLIRLLVLASKNNTKKFFDSSQSMPISQQLVKCWKGIEKGKDIELKGYNKNNFVIVCHYQPSYARFKEFVKWYLLNTINYINK